LIGGDFAPLNRSLLELGEAALAPKLRQKNEQEGCEPEDGLMRSKKKK